VQVAGILPERSHAHRDLPVKEIVGCERHKLDKLGDKGGTYETDF
jgi:hypothetical protein